MIKKDFNYLLFSLTRRIRSIVKAKIKDSPLTFEQIRAISYVSRFEGLSQTELADLLEVKKMAASKLIDALEANALVQREKDANDRRSHKLYLTPKGKTTMKQVGKFSGSMFELVTKDLTEQEISIFFSIMQKIQNNLQDCELQ